MEKLIVCPGQRERNNLGFEASIPLEEKSFIWLIKRKQYHPKSVTGLVEFQGVSETETENQGEFRKGNFEAATLDINKLEMEAWTELDLTVNIFGHAPKPQKKTEA